MPVTGLKLNLNSPLSHPQISPNMFLNNRKYEHKFLILHKFYFYRLEFLQSLDLDYF